MQKHFIFRIYRIPESTELLETDPYPYQILIRNIMWKSISIMEVPQTWKTLFQHF